MVPETKVELFGYFSFPLLEGNVVPGAPAATVKAPHRRKPHADGGTEAWKEPGNYQVSSGLPYSVFFFFSPL